MKLLNFGNLEFKWEYGKRILYRRIFVCIEYKLNYLFYHPESFYFRIKPNIKLYKKYYHSNFINRFKRLKKDIKNETT